MRIKKHPILPPKDKPIVNFEFNGARLEALEGEMISSALIASGIHVFGHHEHDHAAQGIFCVNGQCSQCMVIADGRAVKSCMTGVKPGMRVFSCDKMPDLKEDNRLPQFHQIPEIETDVLIIGGGPSGICAALELGALGVKCVIVDDKNELGGKLTLQTHSFFGSRDGCWAGVRGIEIARILSSELEKRDTVRVMLNTTAVAAFKDQKIGLVTDNERYTLVRPKKVLVATGAREKTVLFPGCDLVGVYGAGAFQTLVNRDLVRSAERLFVLGGGNVGLIGAYHAIQAGIKVLGLAEGMAQVGGYKVHLDKIKRLGVPVFTRHTVLRAEGNKEGRLERVVVAEVNDKFQPIAGTEKSWEVDTLLVAVGLSPVNEIYLDAKAFGMDVHVAGDAAEIAEASAAIFGGKIAGRELARALGHDVDIPTDWPGLMKILQSRPGPTADWKADERDTSKVYPLLRCVQEIPCDPCVDSCGRHCIKLGGSTIMGLPTYTENQGACTGCGMCVMVCPGLAITLLYPNHDPSRKTVKLTMAYELDPDGIKIGDEVEGTDFDGKAVCKVKILDIRKRPKVDTGRCLVSVEVPWEHRFAVAAFRLEAPEQPRVPAPRPAEETIVCRCGRITREHVIREIQAGVRDLNEMKATLRTGLGACGGKTCGDLILRIFREQGIPMTEVTQGTRRPLVAEVPLASFAGVKEDK
jgi:NADPH-dependent 2,4-dienoyl-CoA reductase/sulfur reductase-like enzyme/NAD-dependent dihydropyrimidine dehydrogenase PreA subunit/bacterioferritin-associated ferredoxin